MNPPDNLTYGVRAGCGAIAGVALCLSACLTSLDDVTVAGCVVVALVIIGCAFAAARYGDRFWHWLLKWFP
ncbi:MAG: hypothetical protein JKY61_07135 [Planctomycetes bacterium]|nr:hypothetical protein [Planctomycetota bacterium]